MTEMTPVFIKAFDIPDAWFQCQYKILEHGHEYVITRGSYAGQKRKEFDFVSAQITNPGHRPLIPQMPPGLNIPAPTDMDYVNNYLLYLLSDQKTEIEDYTYGERLVNPKVKVNGVEHACGVNPVEEVIRMYKEEGHGTNQATMEIAMPSDIKLADPPCLRIIDTRIRYGKLHFILYFRSWDLWAGLPSNLAGIQLMKEYMGGEIGVEDGEMFIVSKGMHLYEYAWELAKMRTYKTST